MYEFLYSVINIGWISLSHRINNPLEAVLIFQNHTKTRWSKCRINPAWIGLREFMGWPQNTLMPTWRGKSAFPCCNEATYCTDIERMSSSFHLTSKVKLKLRCNQPCNYLTQILESIRKVRKEWQSRILWNAKAHRYLYGLALTKFK